MPTRDAQRSGHKALVAPQTGSVGSVRMSGVENRQASVCGGQYRVERKLVVDWQAHAAEANSEPRRVKPRHHIH
jgi:hypothetical protein